MSKRISLSGPFNERIKYGTRVVATVSPKCPAPEAQEFYNLIAAAPELYEMLSLTQKYAQHWPKSMQLSQDFLKRIEGALAKAEGKI